jgi:hypothetical protein
MPLAAPLILPFAELAGITIAGLGMAAASKKVSDFISDNPEISTQILTTLVPGGVGLNALFKKKAKEDSDDESVEVAPEDKTREERAKEMKKRFKEGKGDKREIGKKGFEEVIKPVKDIEDLLEGEERYDGSLEDAPKPKFDYKKFIRNRNADGGAIGIEVLFEEKKNGGRIGYVGGGLATTQDFANALKSVSAGTTYQQQTQAKEYARNEAANELRAAIQGGGIDSFLGGAGLSNYRSMFPNDRAGTNRQGDFTGTYNARKEQLLDALMNKKLQFTSYAPPPPPTDSLTGMLESQMLPNMADGSMKSLAEQNAIRDRVLAAQKAQEESYYLTDPISGKKYTSQDEAINDLGLVTYNQRFADGGRIGKVLGFVNDGENIIGADLKKDPYEQYQDKFQEAFDISKNYPSNSLGPFVEQGMSSDMRHQLGASGGKDTIIDYLSNFGINPQGKFADTVGNLGIGVATALTEIPDAFKMASEAMKRKNIDALTSGKFLTQPLEDVRSNFAAMNIPYGLTTQEKENLILSNYPGYVPNITTPNYSYGTAAAADFQDGQILQPNVVPERIAPATYYNSAPNFNADVLFEEEDAQYNLPQKNIFQRAGNFIGKLNLEDYLPFIGQKSLTGTMGRGIGNLFQNIAPARYGTSQRAYNDLTPQGRSTVGSIYGPGGIMSGYNAVSAFGRGPIGAIDNRIGNIYNRRAPQTDASKKTIQDLYKAREKIMQTTLDSDNQYTGPKAAPRGQTPGVMDDDPFGGTSGTTGGSSKIVCTMMNESYGFGNFRNKIWLKHSRDLPKEYEIGYHTIFLPLVKFAKGEGKLNKVVKKTLEHIARHRTLDLKQEMRGKTHTLGRVYRKILEPICLMVGKIKKEVK